MKTSWQVDSFNLDLTSLWNLTKGISLQSEHRTLFDTAWNNFKKKSDSSLIGFFDWPAHCPQNEFAKILSLSQTISKNFEGAICIGIGGSYLGPAALQEALVSCSSASHFPVLWVSNADDGTLLRAKHFLKNRRAATVVISKSGVTTETLAAWFHLSHELDPTGYVLITDPEKGELRRLSRTENWHSLAIPPNIGGRFSVLTSVGLFPLALQGVDVQELIKGARAMREHLLATSPQENPAVWFAYSKYLWDKQGHSIQYFMPYDSRLKLIGDWYVQLWAESLGKKRLDSGKSVGPNPVAALGTSDQHSLLQLFKEGPQTRIVGFLDLLDEQSSSVSKPRFSSPSFEYLCSHSFSALNRLASHSTQESLGNAQVPTYRITLKKLSPYHLGGLLFFLETACAIAGEIYGVNAFDQPGVEETKLLLRQKL